MASLQKKVANKLSGNNAVAFKISGANGVVDDKELKASIFEYITLKDEISFINERLKQARDIISVKAKEILEDCDETTITLLADNESLKVVFAWDINISDEAKLNELLGSRFDDLVNTKISYTPTAKLKDMSLSDDGLKECLSIKQKAPIFTILR